jgi:spermidine synthase
LIELFDEGLHTGINLALKVDNILYREKTELQDLMIFENNQFGRVMSLDGAIQTTERDEFIYHEMFVHVPVFAHGNVKRVLIVGGGDGGAARQLMKHAEIEVTLVEIDRTVIELSQRYLPSISGGAFQNPKLQVVIKDGREFVKDTNDKWDVVIIDSTDPHGPGEVLYTEEFYIDCKSCLAEGGVIVTQNGVPFVQEAELRTSYDRLSSLFTDVSFYLAAIPSYVGGAMAFGWATNRKLHRNTSLLELTRRYVSAGIETDYYTPEVHQSAFSLPLHIQRMLTKDMD